MEKVKLFFKHRFWNSFKKVLLLLAFTFIPLILNIVISAIAVNDFSSTIAEKILPGEMLAYCLGLIAPLFLFLLKTHGDGFKIPALTPIFVVSLIIYITALILTFIAKNKLIAGIDSKAGHKDLYFWLSVFSLVMAILLRIYTDYQDSRYVDYKKLIDNQQQSFNNTFRNSLG